MPKRKDDLSFIDRFMNEVISYGGIPLRRCDVYKLAQKADPDWKPGKPCFGPDYQAFAPVPIDADPWTIEEFEAFHTELEARRATRVGQMELPL